jgi:hypothetical protein
VFAKRGRVLLAPLAVLALVVFLFGKSVALFSGREAGFFWNVLLGLALGLALGLLPVLSGDAMRERFALQRWIACALIGVALIYQFAAAFWGLDIPWMRWLHAADTPRLLAEGCLLGYCIFGALRAGGRD